MDRIIPTVANCWSRCNSEILGDWLLLNVPLISNYFYRHSKNSYDHHFRHHWPHPEDPHQQPDQAVLRLHPEARPGVPPQPPDLPGVQPPVQRVQHDGRGGVPLLPGPETLLPLGLRHRPQHQQTPRQ